MASCSPVSWRPKVVTEDYRLNYNHRRPHSSLDYRTPAAFATAGLDKAWGLCPQTPGFLPSVGEKAGSQTPVTLIATGT